MNNKLMIKQKMPNQREKLHELNKEWINAMLLSLI